MHAKVFSAEGLHFSAFHIISGGCMAVIVLLLTLGACAQQVVLCVCPSVCPDTLFWQYPRLNFMASPINNYHMCRCMFEA